MVAACCVVLSRRDLAETGLADSSRSSVPSILSSAVFLRRFLRAMALSSASAEDVLRFRRTRDPSNGSSLRTSLSNTVWESGLMPPFCGGNRSRANFGAVDRREAGVTSTSRTPLTELSSSGSSPASESSPTQSGHLQFSGPCKISELYWHQGRNISLCWLVNASFSRAHC